MSNPKGKTIPEVINTYLLMLLIYCLDLFLLQSDRSVLGDNFYSRFVCIVVLFIILWVKKTSFSVLGITRNKKTLLSGFIQGIFFSVIPLAIVTALECVYYALTDTTAIALKFNPPSMKFVYSSENLTPFIAVMIYILATIFGSVFKEFFFRGYTLKKLKKVMDFNSANLIQAVLYMLMTAPYLLRNFLFRYYDDATTELIVFIIAFYIIHETVAGIKWGLMTRLTGSTAAAVFDHFFYVFLANSIYITDRYVTWSFMTHMLAIQLLSLGLVYIFYRKGMKDINQKKAEEALALAEAEAKREKEKQEQANSTHHHTEKLPEIGNIETISPNQFKQISRSANHRRSEHTHSRPQPKASVPSDEMLHDFSEEDIDLFLMNYSQPKKATRSASSDRLNGDFDPDKFLENYGRSQKRQEQRKAEKQSENRPKLVIKTEEEKGKTQEAPKEEIPETAPEPSVQEQKKKRFFTWSDIFAVDTSEDNELL